MDKTFTITKDKIKQTKFPTFRVGDVVKVHRRVKEGSKERIQIIEGEIIAHKHGFQPGGSITLRRVTLGVAVELVLPIHSPYTEKIVIVKRQKVRRAKLYYLREIKGKKSKLKENIEGTKQMRAIEEKNREEEKNKEIEKLKKAQDNKKESAIKPEDKLDEQNAIKLEGTEEKLKEVKEVKESE